MIHGELNLNTEAANSLEKLLPRLQSALAEQIAADPQAWQTFTQRLEAHFPVLFRLYHQLYATRYDFFYHLEGLLSELARAAFARPTDLRALDAQRKKTHSGSSPTRWSVGFAMWISLPAIWTASALKFRTSRSWGSHTCT